MPDRKENVPFDSGLQEIGRNEISQNDANRPGNLAFFFAFPPKAQNLLIEAGLLAHLTFTGLLKPIAIGSMAKWCKSFSLNDPVGISQGQTYSCGDSSGFAPDSLFIPSAE